MALHVRGARFAGLAGLGLAVLLSGCEGEKKKSPAPAAAASDAPAAPMLGGKLGQAVAQGVSGGTPSPQASAKSTGDGPPENGIFEPGVADTKLAPSAPPKIELLGEGNEPKLALSYSVPAKTERKSTALLQIRVAQQGLAPLAIDMVWKADKPKDDKAKDDKDTPPPSSFPVVVKLASMKALRGEVPKDLEKLKDTVFRYRLSRAGVITDLVVEPPKETTPAIELATGSLTDVLTEATMPLPDKPVGVGATWMVTDRTRSSGVDVVRYRVATVTKVDGKNVSLSVEVRQYAVNTALVLSVLPKDAAVSLEGYDSKGKGQLDLEMPDQPFLPAKAQVAVAMQGMLKAPEQQAGQKLAIQTETRAAIDKTP